jgi:hypothetical protein
LKKGEGEQQRRPGTPGLGAGRVAVGGFARPVDGGISGDPMCSVGYPLDCAPFWLRMSRAPWARESEAVGGDDGRYRMACSKKKKKKKKKGGEKGLQGKNRRIKELMLMNDGIQ